MHTAALEEMTRILDGWQLATVNLLDVGSYDVNGTYRPMVERRGWQYTGIDVCAGPNVDIVASDPYHFPLADNTYDVVISGSTMEHVQAIWLWVPELVRVLNPGGLLAIITHTSFPYHRYPVDCYRIMPDGMSYLFNITGKLQNYDIRMYNDTDISGVAVKVAV